MVTVRHRIVGAILAIARDGPHWPRDSSAGDEQIYPLQSAIALAVLFLVLSALLRFVANFFPE
jgi:hypothetical protein